MNNNEINMDALYAEAQMAATKYGTALKSGDIAEQATAKAVLENKLAGYNKLVTDNAYDEVLAAENPIREAIVKKEFSGVIKAKVVRDKETQRVNTVIVTPDANPVQFSLQEVKDRCERNMKVCSLQENWYEAAIGLYKYFSALSVVEVGANKEAYEKRVGYSVDSVITTYDGKTIEDMSVDSKSGKTKKVTDSEPVSKRTIQRLLQDAFDRILPGEIKLNKNYPKGDFNPYNHLTLFATNVKLSGNMKTADPRQFVYEVKNCMHYLITGNRPELLDKKIK